MDAQIRIPLNKDSKIPYYVQVSDHLRLLIDNGKLEKGSKLPSVRQLADSLGINVNTAVKAYQELEREGYVETRKGLGTYVSGAVPGKYAAEHRIESGEPGLGAAKEKTKQYLLTEGTPVESSMSVTEKIDLVNEMVKRLYHQGVSLDDIKSIILGKAPPEPD